jgi:hypothetical protein
MSHNLITAVMINFCDRDLKYGLRSNVRHVSVKLDNASEKLHNRLWKKDGKIKNPLGFNGAYFQSMPNQGILTYKLDDNYDGKDIKLMFNDHDKQKLYPALGEQHDNISDFTEYMVVKTYFQNKETPLVEIFHIPKGIAETLPKDRRYGMVRIKLSESTLWESIGLYYNLSHRRNEENFVNGIFFSYLNLKTDAQTLFTANMFEVTPPYVFPEPLSYELIPSSQVDSLLDEILFLDKKFKEMKAFTNQ